ncbi:MAG: M23 family metallopeptidase [Bacteroidetes bacterium]|nr:M23 family metallopeptidase [Bacteroidota bacterium]MBS1629262.1 M23 family metallopeptidase [Bacteroidota bacterium]
MRKVRKYFYNTSTNSFEKFVLPLRTKLLRVLGFLSASTVTALIMLALAYRFLPSPGEKRSEQDLLQLREEYGTLRGNLAQLDADMTDLEQRDNKIYRSIFEATPLPDSVRNGKLRSIRLAGFSYLSNEELIGSLLANVKQLRHRITMQSKSYDTLQHLVETKEQMLAAIPAIQPVNNKDLRHIASGFGYRIDPIYKTPKLHTGLDFACALGTPIYATGNGIVNYTGYDEKGYGNHVIINHGYGYETLYGHMVRIKVHRGQRVKRGEVIGWVGNTGKSTGPHCHYEVIRNGEKIDPIHYFFNDLNAAEYERLVKLAAVGNQSFD